MGMSNLKFEDLEEQFFVDDSVLPKWAKELSAKGYEGVSAIDFYDDIENITSILIQNIDNNLINQNFFRKELKDLIRK